MRLSFVTGATPDKWARRYREITRGRLDLVPVEESEQVAALRRGEVDMALVRLPVEADGLHVVRLYDEVPVVVAGVEHLVSVAEEVGTDDLADEQLVAPERSGWRPSVPQQSWPAMSTAEAVEVVASGTGVVVLPLALARLHHRRDVLHRPVRDLPASTIALTWRVEDDGPRAQRFVGIVRGRTGASSRG